MRTVRLFVTPRIAAVAFHAIALSIAISALQFGTSDSADSADSARHGAEPERQADAGRTRQNLNSGWSFRAAGDEIDGWHSVAIPHTWNIDAGAEYRRGLGIYRRGLTIPDDYEHRRFFLYFEGANQVTEVYVNGTFAGSHSGGYTAFAFDISELVWAGDDNEIEVLVDNSHNDDVPPLDADFTFYGGIYRDVWLISTSEVHIDVLDYAGPGVYVSTPVITEDAARVEVNARVTNDATTPTEALLRLTIADGAGRTICQDSVVVFLTKGATSSITRTLDLTGISQWSPEEPTLYRLKTEVIVQGESSDAVEATFGIRSVLVDGDGFYLNGLPYQLIGTNRHQDYRGPDGSFGNALADSLHENDIAIVKETGFNFLRLAHYPQDPAVVGEADRVGLAVWEEIPVVNAISLTESFAANAETMLREMIRQHYNHPSIVVWGLMNEALLRQPEPLPSGYRDSVRTLAERLQRVVRQEDPNRPTGLAVSFHEVYDGSGVSEVADILGMNLYFGWYYGNSSGDFNDFGAFLDSLHAAHPKRPLFVTEYGAGSDERVHASSPVAFDFSSEYALTYHRASLPQLLERDYLVGAAVWNQFDFGSSARQDTKDGVNQKGLYNFDRTPKDQARYYRAALGLRSREHRILEFEADHTWRWGWSESDRSQSVLLFTNADSVVTEALSGSRSMAIPRGGVAAVNVELRPGRNDIQAVGWWNGAVQEAARITLNYQEATDCSRSCGYAINVGGEYSFVGDRANVAHDSDSAPRIFMPDSVAGTSTARRIHHRIAATDEEPRFQAFREWDGVGEITLPLAASGEYEVTLGFVEPDHADPGMRLFSVRLLGGDAYIAIDAPNAIDAPLRNIDLAEQVGRWTAVERKTTFVAKPGQSQVVIRLIPIVGKPILSSVRIERR